MVTRKRTRKTKNTEPVEEVKMGRKPKDIDVEQAKKLAAIQCTRIEQAAFFGVSEDTFDRRVKEWGYKSYKEFFAEHRQAGFTALRTELMRKAKKDSKVLIHLSKSLLGNAERQEHTGADGKDLIPATNINKDKLAGLPDEQLDALLDIFEADDDGADEA